MTEADLTLSFDGHEIVDQTGRQLKMIGISIPMTDGPARDRAVADIRRIVACVNACKGIETKNLEALQEVLMAINQTDIDYAVAKLRGAYDEG